MTDKVALKKLTDHVVAAVTAASKVERPFYHLEFGNIFPDDVYAQMLDAMPKSSDYRALPGRNGGNLRADGSSTRVKIDLFPEYIRHLREPKRTVWDLVGRALTSDAVRDAFIEALAPGLEKRFGKDFRDTGMYPIPVLTRDIPVDNSVETRDSILLTYFVDAGLLRFLRNRGKRVGNFVLNEARNITRQ